MSAVAIPRARITGERRFLDIALRRRVSWRISGKRALNMQRTARRWLTVASFAAAFLCAASPIAAQEKFFEGKTIRIIVGFSPGGGFDAHSRAIARHMGKHIAGKPTVVVENMAGAGSLITANHIYNQAKPDGLTIGNWIGGLIIQQYLNAKGVSFDAQKFEWLGSPVRINNICAFTKRSGIINLERWQQSKTLVKIGAEAAGSTTADIPRLLMKFTKLPIQLIEGYKGVADVRLAAESGEVAGFCSSWEGTKAAWRNVLDAGEGMVVLQAVSKAHPEHPKIPLAVNLMQSKEGRELFTLVVQNAGGTINRLYSLPPATPKDRVRALQKAFQDTMKDAEFLAEAKKARLDVDPITGEEIEKTIVGIKNIPPATFERLKGIILP
jgi:tripartite-type tricarboxylate transporter receptor subunit TctC